MLEIEGILQELGITRNYKGYRRIQLILSLALDNEDRLEAVTKELYMEAAAQLNCGWKAIEHSLRTIVKRAWKTNRAFIQKMAGYSMNERPVNSEFLSIIVGYIQRYPALSERS